MKTTIAQMEDLLKCVNDAKARKDHTAFGISQMAERIISKELGQLYAIKVGCSGMPEARKAASDIHKARAILAEVVRL
jgi:hypothetical protein